MITSKFNTESNILETTFSGDVYAQEMIDFVLSFKDDTSYPRRMKSIIMATEANLKFSFKGLRAINDANIETTKKYEFVVFAIVIDNSFTAAMGSLYQTISNNEKHKFNVFSTPEAALLWINSFNI